MSLSTVVVVPLTRSAPPEEVVSTVRFTAGEANLPFDCVALCHQIRAIDPERRLRRLIGVAPPERVAAVEALLAFLLGLPG